MHGPTDTHHALTMLQWHGQLAVSTLASPLFVWEQGPSVTTASHPGPTVGPLSRHFLPAQPCSVRGHSVSILCGLPLTPQAHSVLLRYAMHAQAIHSCSITHN